MNGVYLKCFSQRDCYSRWNPLVVRVQHSVFDSAEANVEKKKLVYFLKVTLKGRKHKSVLPLTVRFYILSFLKGCFGQFAACLSSSSVCDDYANNQTGSLWRTFKEMAHVTTISG